MTELPNPPASPVQWKVLRVVYTEGSEPRTEAQTAFEARRKLAVMCHAAPEELEIEMVAK